MKSEYVQNMDPMLFQKRYVREEQPYSNNTRQDISTEFHGSEPMVRPCTGSNVAFSNDEISFLGTLLLDDSRFNISFPEPRNHHSMDFSAQIKENIEPKGEATVRKRRRNKRSTWTAEEDALLKREMTIRDNKRYYGMWKEIAASIGGKHTHKECHDRFTKNLDPKLNKGRWTIEEDQHFRSLLALPEMQTNIGDFKWPAIARKLKRCPKQVLIRLIQLVKRLLGPGTFSEQRRSSAC